MQCGVDDGTLGDQGMQCSPARRVETEDDVEMIADVPWLTIAGMTDQPAPKPVEPQLNVAISALDASKDIDQLFRRVHADVAMEDRPANLKGSNQVALRPSQRPVLQAKIARRDRAIRRLASGERTTLDRASREDRVCQVREFFFSSRMSRRVILDER